jgi:hypothetical protein
LGLHIKYLQQDLLGGLPEFSPVFLEGWVGALECNMPGRFKAWGAAGAAFELAVAGYMVQVAPQGVGHRWITKRP